ncbi:MAG: hypothetical protein WC836_19560 [Desulfobacula sp.]|jgi:hypothetical protein
MIFFKRVLGENAWVFYTHDPVYAASKLSYDKESNKYAAVDLIKDLTLLNSME